MFQFDGVTGKASLKISDVTIHDLGEYRCSFNNPLGTAETKGNLVVKSESDTVFDLSILLMGVQWLSGRVLDSRPRGHEFKCHCVVSLSKNINPSIVLVQPRITRSFITERLLMGSKESN